LIQIADPDSSSKTAKQEKDMAIVRNIIVKRGEMFGGAGIATLTTYRKTPKPTIGCSGIPFDLNNLPFDPAEEAMKSCHALSASIAGSFVECELAQSEGYRERLCLKSIPAVPSLVELSIQTQLFGTKHPKEWRVKSRTCLELSQLEELYKSMGLFLTAQQKP
jgi:hypothetical protein